MVSNGRLLQSMPEGIDSVLHSYFAACCIEYRYEQFLPSCNSESLASRHQCGSIAEQLPALARSSRTCCYKVSSALAWPLAYQVGHSPNPCGLTLLLPPYSLSLSLVADQSSCFDCCVRMSPRGPLRAMSLIANAVDMSVLRIRESRWPRKESLPIRGRKEQDESLAFLDKACVPCWSRLKSGRT